MKIDASRKNLAGVVSYKKIEEALERLRHTLEWIARTAVVGMQCSL